MELLKELNKNVNKILVTGSAGFIGFHLSKRLLELEFQVIGIDNINAYYSQSLKLDRLKILEEFKNFEFRKIDINDTKPLKELFENNQIDYVINLAAQAGVRISKEKPLNTIEANIVGFTNLLQTCAESNVKHFIFASSSSIYGENKNTPYNETLKTDSPISLYAATKKANELIAHSYSINYNIPVTGIRFFTVYGPWGRPDMAYFKFVDRIINNKEIELFNNGNMMRDFTFIDDAVDALNLIFSQIVNNSVKDLYRIINIGCNKPIQVIKLVEQIEKEIGTKAKIINKSAPTGDVSVTCADISFIQNNYNYSPSFTFEKGMKSFIKWHREYYKIKE